jgi:hypothetical protein
MPHSPAGRGRLDAAGRSTRSAQTARRRSARKAANGIVKCRPPIRCYPLPVGAGRLDRARIEGGRVVAGEQLARAFPGAHEIVHGCIGVAGSPRPGPRSGRTRSPQSSSQKSRTRAG